MSRQIILFPVALDESNLTPLTKWQRIGRSGEQLYKPLLRYSLGHCYQILSNDFNNYAKSQGKGVDFKVYLGKQLIYAIELKNWKWQPKRTYSAKDVKEQILARFQGIASEFKILIISYKKLLSEEGLRLLAENNIKVYEVGHQFFIGSHNPKANPEFFFEQVGELKHFFNNLDQSFFSLQQTLDSIEQTQTAAEPPHFSYFSQSKEELSFQLANQCNQSNQFLIESSSDISDSLTNPNSLNSNLSNLTSDSLTDNQLTDNQITHNQINPINQLKIKHDTPNNQNPINEQIISISPYQKARTQLYDG